MSGSEAYVANSLEDKVTPDRVLPNGFVLVLLLCVL